MTDVSSAASRIKEYAAELGIDGIGVCDAGVLDGVRDSLEAAVRRGLIPQAQAPSAKTMDRMTNPALHVKGARSVLSAYESYWVQDPDAAGPDGDRVAVTGSGLGIPDSATDPGSPGPDPARAAIAYYTRANFYLDLRRRLERLSELMAKEFGCRTKAFSNYVTLTEKPLARKAGLGFYGKNGVIVTPDHGSFVVLGEIITDLELEPDEGLDLDCGDCRLCMDACPTGAIVEPHTVSRSLCIQHLSERSCIVPLEIREVWGDRLYGCTTCQDVCPYNRNLAPADRTVSVGYVGASLPLGEVLTMNEGWFQAKFADNQIGRRELRAIRRNAIIAAGHSGSQDLVPLLVSLAADRDSETRQHSLWATWKLLGPESEPILRGALESEGVPEVRAEISTLLGD